MNDAPRLPKFAAAWCLALGLVLGFAAHAQDEKAAAPGLDPAEALRASQAAVGTVVGDYTLLDREGRPVRLASYRGKPLLVSFIYTGCFQVCPTATRALGDAVQVLQARMGTGRFNVVSIGFNQPADSPQALKAFAAQHRIATPDWEFLSPPPRIVDSLTREFGFRYQATPAGFDHLLQVTLVDAEGRIASQVYGERITADALAVPIQQMMEGAPLAGPLQISALIERVRVLCTVYDPKTGTYRVDYSLAIEIAGGLTFFLAMLLYMFNEWRGRKRRA
jgi:protein SCO1/2